MAGCGPVRYMVVINLHVVDVVEIYSELGAGYGIVVDRASVGISYVPRVSAKV